MAQKTLFTRDQRYRRLANHINLKRWRFSAVICFITLVAFGLRVYLLMSADFWHDEQHTLDLIINRGLVELLFTVPVTEPHFPVYYVLLEVWLAGSDTMLLDARMFSATWGALTVGMAAVLAKEWYDRRTAYWVAIIISVNSYHLYWSRQARMYTFLAFLAIASFYLLTRLEKSRGWAVQVTYAITILVLVFTHYYAIYILAVHALFHAYRYHMTAHRDRAIYLGAVLAVMAPAITIMALKVVFWQAANQVVGTAQPHHFPEGAPGLYRIIEAIGIMAHGWVQPITIEIVGGVILVLGAVVAHGHTITSSSDSPYDWLLVAWFWLPILGVVVALHVMDYSAFAPRYLIASSIALYISYARQVRRIDQPWGELAAVGLIVITTDLVQWLV